MKKIYALAMAALTCGSLFAEGRQAMSQTSVEPISPINSKMALVNAPVGMQKKAAAKAFESIEDFAGAWELTCQPLLNNMSGILELYIEVTDAATGKLTLSGWPQNFEVEATVDLQNKIFTIPNNQYLGKDSYGDTNYFYIKAVDSNYEIADGSANVEATYGEINGNNVIFPELDIWAIGDPNEEDLGWWFLSYTNQMSQPIQVDPNEGWESFGTATFEDGWTMAGFGYEASMYPWTVNISKSTEEVDLYRIDCPYTAADSPVEGEAGYIVFDLSDPNFVRVLPDFFSGMRNGPTTKLYYFNIEGFLSDYSAEDIKQQFADQISEWSSFKDGIVNILNCRFDIQTPCTKLYVWQDQQNNSLEYLMKTKITFDNFNGVNAINTADSNKVEFFNLQGMPVANPASGELVIKRTANGTVKTIIR